MTRTAHFYLKTLLITFLAVVILSYAYYQSRNFIRGPQLSIEAPINGSVFSDPYIEIKGKAENISKITLNERAIFVDEEGVFLEKMLLAPGYNIFKIEVEDKFKRTNTKFLELVYKEGGTKSATPI